VALLISFAALACDSASAADFTVINQCSDTVYPGIDPASYTNGGWEMAAGTSVSFTLDSGWIGRIWDRAGCNSASTAVCATGSCGGEGLQCAGTTGLAGTSFAEFNIDANGTDLYEVSSVDGFDHPIGISVSDSSCSSANTCATGANYTVTFCPDGGSASMNGPHTLTPANAPGSRLQGYLSGTADGNPVDIWTANGTGTGTQSWVFSNIDVVPSGFYNITLSYGPYCLTANGSDPNSPVSLQVCDGSTGQAWEVSGTRGNYQFHPATNTALCLDVNHGATSDGTPVLAYTCTGNNSQSWSTN
jgi:hypothetical protein